VCTKVIGSSIKFSVILIMEKRERDCRHCVSVVYRTCIGRLIYISLSLMPSFLHCKSNNSLEPYSA
jgi:hypothetical protein